MEGGWSEPRRRPRAGAQPVREEGTENSPVEHEEIEPACSSSCVGRDLLWIATHWRSIGVFGIISLMMCGGLTLLLLNIEVRENYRRNL